MSDYNVSSVTKCILESIPPNKFIAAPPAPFKRRGAVVYKPSFSFMAGQQGPQLTEIEPLNTSNNPTFIPPPTGFTNGTDNDDFDDGENYDAALQDLDVEYMPNAAPVLESSSGPESQEGNNDDHMSTNGENFVVDDDVHAEAYDEILEQMTSTPSHSTGIAINNPDEIIKSLSSMNAPTYIPYKKPEVGDINLLSLYDFKNDAPTEPAPEPPESDGNDTDDDIFV